MQTIKIKGKEINPIDFITSSILLNNTSLLGIPDVDSNTKFNVSSYILSNRADRSFMKHDREGLEFMLKIYTKLSEDESFLSSRDPAKIGFLKSMLEYFEFTKKRLNVKIDFKRESLEGLFNDVYEALESVKDSSKINSYVNAITPQLNNVDNSDNITVSDVENLAVFSRKLEFLMMKNPLYIRLYSPLKAKIDLIVHKKAKLFNLDVEDLLHDQRVIFKREADPVLVQLDMEIKKQLNSFYARSTAFSYPSHLGGLAVHFSGKRVLSSEIAQMNSFKVSDLVDTHVSNLANLGTEISRSIRYDQTFEKKLSTLFNNTLGSEIVHGMWRFGDLERIVCENKFVEKFYTPELRDKTYSQMRDMLISCEMDKKLKDKSPIIGYASSDFVRNLDGIFLDDSGNFIGDYKEVRRNFIRVMYKVFGDTIKLNGDNVRSELDLSLKEIAYGGYSLGLVSEDHLNNLPNISNKNKPDISKSGLSTNPFFSDEVSDFL